MGTNSRNDYKVYRIITPDSNYLSFSKILYPKAIELLGSENYKEGSVSFLGSSHKVYFLSNKKILFEKTLDKSYFFLFDNNSDYNNYLGGKLYWNTSVYFDEDAIYSMFRLECNKTHFFIEKSIKTDKTYQIHDNSQVYTLYYQPDGSICYLSHRINNWYDGYWFANFSQFEYIYKHVLNI
jgi:hypothetical protein